MNGPIRRVIYICPYATTQIMSGVCPWATSINGMPCGFRSWGCDDLYLCDDEAAQYWAEKADEGGGERMNPLCWGEHPRMCAQCYSCRKWVNGCTEGRKPIPTRRCLGYEPVDGPKVQEAETRPMFGEDTP